MYGKWSTWRAKPLTSAWKIADDKLLEGVLYDPYDPGSECNSANKCCTNHSYQLAPKLDRKDLPNLDSAVRRRSWCLISFSHSAIWFLLVNKAIVSSQINNKTKRGLKKASFITVNVFHTFAEDFKNCYFYLREPFFRKPRDSTLQPLTITIKTESTRMAGVVGMQLFGVARQTFRFTQCGCRVFVSK